MKKLDWYLTNWNSLVMKYKSEIKLCTNNISLKQFFLYNPGVQSVTYPVSSIQRQFDRDQLQWVLKKYFQKVIISSFEKKKKEKKKMPKVITESSLVMNK